MSRSAAFTFTEPASHPRPHFRRARWTSLDGRWSFAFDDADRGLTEKWFADNVDAIDGTIVVPYPPESKLSEVADTAFHPILWYVRRFVAPSRTGDERLLLHFGAVDYHATVWVNGLLAGEHIGGHTPFTLDVTGLLRSDLDEQVVVVRAEDRPTDVEQPRGKQTSSPEPHGVFYDRTSGIWQPVWLEVVPRTHLVDIAWNTDPESGTVELEASFDRPLDSAVLEVRLLHDGEVTAEQSTRVTGATAHVPVAIPALLRGRGAHLLWSPESPTLIDAEIELRSDDDVDRVASYVGLRSVGYRDGLFLLNGRPYYLRMALEQGFWPESHLAAPSGAALRREVELTKELGFNGVRVHQKVEDPRFLYWCDRLGLLVWGEMANAFAFSVRAVERFTAEWVDVVRRDRSHPSIVAWVPLNESWGVPRIATSERQRNFATSLYHLTKALDPTRLVISNDGWEHTTSDIWGVHDYSPSGDSIRRRYGTPEALDRTLFGAGPGRRKVMLTATERDGQPVVLTEFGGLSYTPAAGDKWFGYGTVESPEELRAGLEDLVGAILDLPDVAGFCYTQLTDTQQERNGLLTEDRAPKLPVEVIREILTRPSRAIPAEAVDASRRAARRAAEGKGR
ncbi:MAG TPA: sugar-binding domain-containing protein [Actinopolymorphaceae bacterium]